MCLSTCGSNAAALRMRAKRRLKKTFLSEVSPINGYQQGAHNSVCISIAARLLNRVNLRIFMREKGGRVLGFRDVPVNLQFKCSSSND
ncbi:hypothetical protein MRX96_000959 [Rhipicephalus microplus]